MLRSLRVTLLFAFLAIALAASGCSKNSGGARIAAPNAGGGGTGPAPMTMTLDGVPWAGDMPGQNPLGDMDSLGLRFIPAYRAAGPGQYQQAMLTLMCIDAVGTYPLGMGPLDRGGNLMFIDGGRLWSTPPTGAAGTVTITAIDATHIAGPFSCDLEGDSTTTPRVRHVTSGAFDLPISANTVRTVPNLWSAVTMTLDSQPWTGAFTMPMGVMSSMTPWPLFGSGNRSTLVMVWLGMYHGTGHYSIPPDSTSTGAYVELSSPESLASWGGLTTPGTGEVVITNVTATRVQGTVNVTLPPFVGTSTTRTITNLQFDVPLTLSMSSPHGAADAAARLREDLRTFARPLPPARAARPLLPGTIAAARRR